MMSRPHSSWRVEQVSVDEYIDLRTPRQPLLQSVLWGELKSAFGWTAHHLRIFHPQHPPSPLLVLTRSMPLGKQLAYIAYGPTLPASIGSSQYGALLCEISDAIATLLPRVPFIVRWDPPFRRDLHSDLRGDLRSDLRSDLRASPRLLLAPHSVQPRHTVVVDLRPDEDEIMGRMKAKTRYNIRLAARKGVEVRQEQEVSRWYALYHDTCVRNRIGQRPISYFQTLLRLGRRSQQSAVRIELLCAYHDNTLLGGIIVAYYNGTATYLFGASANTMRNLMANYLLQWEGMRRAKEEGCEAYDLFGVSPADRGHYLSGLYRFKSGFGGEFIERWGSVDYIVAPFWGAGYRLVERVYFFYHRRIRTR